MCVCVCVCLYLHLCLCLHVQLRMYLSVHQCISAFVILSFFLSFCPSVYVSLSMSVCMSVMLPTSCLFCVSAYLSFCSLPACLFLDCLSVCRPAFCLPVCLSVSESHSASVYLSVSVCRQPLIPPSTSAYLPACQPASLPASQKGQNIQQTPIFNLIYASRD